MLPTIEKFLDSRAGGYTGGLLAVNYPKLKSRNFWIATIIEITRAGPPPAHVGIGGSQLEPPRSFRRLHLVRGRWSRGRTIRELPAGAA